MRYPVIKQKYSGELRLDAKAMEENLGSGNNIFVVAQNDLFAADVPEKFIKQIIVHCGKYDNKYLFQTKNPENARRILPMNSSICVTLETNRWYPEHMKKSPKPIDRIEQMLLIRHPLYITIEPIMDFDLDEFITMIEECEPLQVNIGADSGNNHLPEPSKEKLLALIGRLKMFTVIDKKTNLERLLK